MHITVVSPPVEDFYFTPHRASALGVEAVCTAAEKGRHSCRKLNFPAGARGTAIPLPDQLSYLSPFVVDNETGPLSFFTRYKRFGPGYADCAAVILEEKTDILLISCFAFCYADSARRLADEVHRLNTDLPICIGGAGATVNPGYFLESTSVRWVLTGETETTLLPFLERSAEPDAHLPPLPGLVSAAGETAVSAQGGHAAGVRPDEGELPFIWSVTGESRERIFISVLLSRGCPRNCSFCSVRLTHGSGFRRVPAEHVRKEIEALEERIGRRKVVFNCEDDNLLADPDHTLNILSFLKERWPDAGFTAENGIDYTLLSIPLMEQLGSYGFFRFNFSLGTGRNREQLEKLIPAAQSRKMEARVFFICGHEEDSPAGFIETMAWLRRMQVTAGISLYYPVPGIPFRNSSGMKRNFFPPLMRGSSAFPWTGSFTTRQLVTAFRISRLNNLLLTDSDNMPEKLPAIRSIREKRLFTLVKNHGTLSVAEVPEYDRTLFTAYADSVEG